MTTENRNVIDYYKGWETESIAADLDQKRTMMVNVCMNLTSDFNKASVIRANNAFRGRCVYLVGRKKYDRRGTVGTHHYEHVNHETDIAVLINTLHDEGYTVYAVDNTPEFHPVSMYQVSFPQKSAFVYGEEQAGLSADVVGMCDTSIYIPQYGSVRSLNVSQAASVAMYEYNRQFDC